MYTVREPNGVILNNLLESCKLKVQRSNQNEEDNEMVFAKKPPMGPS